MEKEKIFIFDTTLRDGEQAAGLRLDAIEKLEIARQLTKLNVDIIEAGFPISSQEDFKAVELISKEIKGPVITGLTRAVPKDIDVCAKALKKAEKPRIHTGMGVSDIHILGKFKDKKYGKSLKEKKDKVFQMSVDAVRRAKKYVDDIEFYPEDAGRANQEYLCQILEGVIDAGATVVNIPDTTGYTVPEQFGALIRNIRENVPNINKAIISVHCHDDLGMAVANTLAGIKNGARQIECTVNGIGERAGNTSLEEVVMSLKVRKDYFNVDTSIKIDELYKTSQLVSRRIGIPVPPNKAIVGANAFAHSSGIHVDGFLKSKDTYEIISPEDVGFPQSKVILTARSGRHALKFRLKELGYDVSGKNLEKVYANFLDLADKVHEVTDDMIISIMENDITGIAEKYKLEYLHISSGTDSIPTATVRIKISKDTKQTAACGSGPVDAVYKAIDNAVDMKVKLSEFSIHAVDKGADTLGEVTIKAQSKGHTVIGQGVSTDIIEASAKAYMDGLNKLAYRINSRKKE